jgi:hypothetical protein
VLDLDDAGRLADPALRAEWAAEGGRSSSATSASTPGPTRSRACCGAETGSLTRRSPDRHRTRRAVSALERLDLEAHLDQSSPKRARREEPQVGRERIELVLEPPQERP